jgi:enediyne biosynthesis protein E3
MKATQLSTRGFHEKSPAAKELLETVGKMFLTGYAYAAEARIPAEAEQHLEELPRQYRGFAYEGAGMGYAMRDGLPFGHTHHVADFLEGRGEHHVYMIYVGVGWALARLPRFRWAAVSANTPDPLLRWLVLDGYGFHQAYFKTDKYVHQHYREPDFPWPADGPRQYADHAIDQGIGRAMWFVGGTDPERVADMIDRFPVERRADLYAGSGLASSYAGGVTEDELWTFQRRAGEFAPQVAQGSTFAATARVEAGTVNEHTKLAARVLCGVTPQQAAEISRQARPKGPVNDDGDLPAFEVWRRQIAAGLVAVQGAKP